MMKKKIFVYFLIAAVIFSPMKTAHSADGKDGNRGISVQEDVAASGTCGENATWKLTENGMGEDGVINYLLTVSGSGIVSDATQLQKYENKINKVIFQEGITEINCNLGSFNFIANNKTIKEVDFPNTLTHIGTEAFYGWKGLKELKFPNSLRSIGMRSFVGCTGLDAIQFNEGLETIGFQAFSSCGSKEDGIEKIEIPESVQFIESSAFQFCVNLQSVWIKGSTKIGGGVFAYCEKLEYVDLGESSQYRDKNYQYAIFRDCPNLKEVKISDQYDFTFIREFSDSKDVKIVLPDNSQKYVDAGDNIIYSKDLKTIYYYPAHLEDKQYFIPAGTEKIGHGAFEENQYLEYVDIPYTVKEMGSHAFSFCGKLKDVILPEGMTEIKPNAFRECNSLERVVIPPSVKQITCDYKSSMSSFPDKRMEDIYFYGESGSYAEEFVTEYGKHFAQSTKVMFDAGGGTTDIKGKNVLGGVPYGALPQAVREGYQFAGWYTQASGGTPVTEKTIVENDTPHTLYAHMIPEAAMTFPDVREGDWFFNAVSYVSEKHIMTGMADGTFAPAQNLSRGQFATILYRMTGSPETTYSSRFPDVPDHQFYTEPVLWASSEDVRVVTGYADGRFGPADNITREQMAVMMYRYAEYKGYDTSARADLSGFPDEGKVSVFSREAMEWAVAAGLISGNEDGTLAPQGEASRAVCATIMMRFIEKCEGGFNPKRDADVYIDAGVYSDYAGEEHIAHDKETGATYFDNEACVFFSGDLEYSISKLKDDISAIIVGKNIYDNSCLIRFEKTATYDELSDICKMLEEKEYVKAAYPNYSLETDTQYYPNDTRWKGLWSEKAEGLNWGVEAIRAPEAWEYQDEMNPVNIGVYDAGFDTSNPDLENVMNAITSGNEKISDVDHGTHVSGTIGAEFNNELGIAGVFPKAKIFGVSCRLKTSSNLEKLAFSYLISVKNCRVINISLGNNLLCFAASQGETTARGQLILNAMVLEMSLLSLNKDFLICTAAGNTSGMPSFIRDEKAVYGYYKLEKNEKGEQGYYDDDDKWNPFSGTGIQSPCDAVWSNSLSCISTPELEGRIIVVGAAELKEDLSYKLASFSNAGERVDVVAPGVDIESTMSSKTFGEMSGTSMASPHVAGLAGMLYSLNDGLTAEKVKKIIVDKADIHVEGSGGKMMVNASAVVEHGLGKEGKLSGRVVDEDGNPIQNAVVTIKGNNHEFFTDESGKFLISTATGNCQYMVHKSGYVPVSGEEKIIHDYTTIILRNIVLRKEDIDIQKISLGQYHSGTVREDGSLWMWGSNYYGKIGDGTTDTRRTPVKIMDNVKAVSLGDSHSGAIKEDGSLWLWGSNSYGEIGDGTTDTRKTPVKVMDHVKALSLGNGFSGAIKEDGSLWMWGSNFHGTLGDVSFEHSKTPIKIMDHVKAVSLGRYHSSAITEDGSLWMWGWNIEGQLGDGTTNSSRIPVKIMDQVKSVSLGDGYSGAIKEDGSLWMWGSNSAGKLGDGTTDDRRTPVKIMDQVKSVSLGANSSGAIKEDGSLWMWGSNLSCNLGDGTSSRRKIPVKIMDQVKSVSLGDHHSGAVTEDGSVWMWGSNASGQFGDENHISYSYPQDITHLFSLSDN